MLRRDDTIAGNDDDATTTTPSLTMTRRLHASLESLLGLRVSLEWTTRCIRAVLRETAGALLDDDEKDEEKEATLLRLAYDQFMFADVNVACHGSITAMPSPDELMTRERHETTLKGRFVVQIDEMADVGKPFSSRYESSSTTTNNNNNNNNNNNRNVPLSRCLKMNATDGKHRYVVYEYSPTPALDALETKAGCKVALIDPKIVNGCLYVDEERLVVLGGQVMRLEAARQRMLKKWREPNRPEELTGESADKRAACEKAAWGRSGAQNQHRQHRQANEAPPVPSSPRQQQQQPRPRQYQQQQPKQQRYNNNAIIELDLDDDAPDEVEIIPNTQIHADNDSLDREDVAVDEQMETVEEEEEEEKEKEDVPERRSRRKHVILTSSEEQTQGTQNDNKNKNKNNNNNRISGGDTPTTATTTATTTNTNRDLHMQSEEFRIAVEVQKNATNGLWSYISCIKRLRKDKVGKPDDKRTIMFSVLVWITRVESIMLKSNDVGGNKWRAKIKLQDSTQYLTVWIKDDQLDPFTECTVDEYASFSEIDRSKVQETFKKNCFRFCGVVLVEALRYERPGEYHPRAVSFLHHGKFKKNVLDALERRCAKTPFV